MKFNIQKTFLALSVSGALLSGASMVHAHDWSGTYVGGTLGLSSLTGSSSNYYGDFGGTESGMTFGLNAGLNWQNGSAVYGIEVDYSKGGMEEVIDDIYGSYYHQETEWNWVTTIRARAGLAVDNTLLYVTGGLAHADVDYKHCYNADCSPNSSDGRSSGSESGLAYGAGMQMALKKNMSVRAEFLRVILDTTKTQREDGDPLDFESSLDTFRVGLNWQF